MELDSVILDIQKTKSEINHIVEQIRSIFEGHGLSQGGANNFYSAINLAYQLRNQRGLEEFKELLHNSYIGFSKTLDLEKKEFDDLISKLRSKENLELELIDQLKKLCFRAKMKRIALRIHFIIVCIKFKIYSLKKLSRKIKRLSRKLKAYGKRIPKKMDSVEKEKAVGDKFKAQIISLGEDGVKVVDSIYNKERKKTVLFRKLKQGLR
ncbi:MAG: hypothetical protein ACMXX5_00860 [Candidatus Woesearchaeota archaeon]